MNAQEFMDKYNGKGIDFDGYYGFQCADLAQQYNKEVVGAGKFSGNAINYWDNYDHNGYEKIANTPTNVPQLGDVVIWGTSVGQYGHVAVFHHGDVNSFTSFEQNWPSGSTSHYQNHNYNGVLGWLRPHKTVTQPDPRDQQIRDLQSACAQKDAEINNLNTRISNISMIVDKQMNEITQLKDTISAKDSEITSLAGQVQTLGGEKVSLTNQVDSLSTTLVEASNTIKNLQEQLNQVPVETPETIISKFINLIKAIWRK